MRETLTEFMTDREAELLEELPELEGKTFSAAADGHTTRKRILHRFRRAGLVDFDRGEPIELTGTGREVVWRER